MRDSIEHKVDGDAVCIGSDNDRALWQEMGTDRIPPRSFLGGAAVEKTEECASLIGSAVFLALAGASKVRK